MAQAIEDPEIAALQEVGRALDTLDEDARGRVIEWAAKRYSVRTPDAPNTEKHATGDAAEYETLGEFFAAAAPTTEGERALISAYWWQVRGNREAFDAQSVNTQLKHLGHHVANITDALDSLKSRKPALVVQLTKHGTTKQARKSYKVTEAGLTFVKKMIADATAPAA